MSDMSRPGPLPPAAPDHDRHDRLLVAQFAAGDPLSPEQQAQAQRLVAGCGACAALAADLPAVSRAVAGEPVPPRRRDYRLSPEQAAELQGTALTRFLRRLSLPSSRAFGPAAAGVLSIGLLLVVAGYAWPDGGTITVQAEPNVVDWTSAAPSSAPAELLAEAPDEAVARAAAEADAETPPQVASQAEPEAGAALDGAERTMEDAEFADSLADYQAGLSEGRTRKSLADEDAPPAPGFEAQVMEAPGLEVREEAAADATDEVAVRTGGGRFADEVDDRSAPVTAGDVVEVQSGPVDGPATVTTPNEAIVDDGLVAQPESATASGEVVVSDDGPVELLVVLGLALALGGAGLLLLGWLARRAKDPLAP